MTRGERSTSARAIVACLAPAAAVGVAAIAARRADSTYWGSALPVAAAWLAAVGVLVGVPAARRVLPAVGPLLAAVAIGAAVSYRAAVLPAAAGVVLAGLMAAGVDVATPLDRAFDALGRGIRAAVGGLAFLVLVIPAWGLTRLRRRDALRNGRAGGWTATASAATPTALGSSIPSTGSGRTLPGAITWGIGCLTVLLVANYGIGWAWDRTFPTDPPPEAATSTSGVTGTMPRDPRNDVPAMAAYPWRERYFDDLLRQTSTYWPFTETRPGDFTSPYVNLRGWERRTYQPTGDLDAMPVAWMFGGSTTWGEGQRDEHTIASEIARLSEEEGIPLQMVNYGQRGWTHFQEMILYEQRLADGPVPDLSIFYDGANEITAQSLLTEAVPTHVFAYTFAKKLTGYSISTEFLQPPPDPDPVGTAWHAYTEHSAIHKVGRWLRGEPAGASPAQDGGDGAPAGIDTDQDEGDDGFVSNYDLTVEDGTDAGKVYERGKQFTMGLNERYGVDGFLFWQPVRYTGAPEDAAIEQLTEPTVDISDALDGHSDVYIDGSHTNEVGARLVAEAIWERVRPAVQAWYEANG